MKANELRIGNICYVKDYEQTHKNKPVTASDILNFDNKEFDIKPIKLTKSWLNKFGFEDDKITVYKGRTMLGQGKNGIWSVFYGTLAHGLIDECKIKYVHELQNLYFALTKKELLCKKS